MQTRWARPRLHCDYPSTARTASSPAHAPHTVAAARRSCGQAKRVAGLGAVAGGRTWTGRAGLGAQGAQVHKVARAIWRLQELRAESAAAGWGWGAERICLPSPRTDS